VSGQPTQEARDTDERMKGIRAEKYPLHWRLQIGSNPDKRKIPLIPSREREMELRGFFVWSAFEIR